MARVPELRFPEFSGEWREVKLGQISRVVGGGTPSTSVSEYWNGAIPWFTPTEIKSKYCEDSKRTITNIGLKNSSAKLLPKGTILLTTRATIGECCIAKQECTTNQGFQNIVAIDGESYNVFLYYLLLTIKRELLKRANGSTFLEISGIEVKKLRISIPSLPEQQKIADFLSAVDEKITLSQEKITRLEVYKKGMMQKLLSGEVRFPGFTDAWREVKLGEVATFSKGKGISKNDVTNEGVPCIRYGQLYTDYGEVIKNIICKTLEAQDLVFASYNDILIPSSGETAIDLATASCIAIVDKVAIGGDVNIIKTDENGIFLAYYLNTVKKIAIAMLAQGVSVVHLYAQHLKSLKISIPSLPEQQRIADFLTAIDDKLTLEKERLEALKRYKQGLLQKMFV